MEDKRAKLHWLLFLTYGDIAPERVIKAIDEYAESLAKHRAVKFSSHKLSSFYVPMGALEECDYDEFYDKKIKKHDPRRESKRIN